MCAVAVLLTIPLAAPLAAQEPTGHLKVLADFDVAPSAQSIGDYLTSLNPSPRERELLSQLVAQLGNDSYSARESASKQLLRRPTGVIPVLEEATKSGDPEIRWRSKQILDHSERESRRLLDAVFATVQKQKIAGLAGPLFGAVPLCKDEYLRLALRRALLATSGPDDLPLLKEMLSSSEVQTRIAAISTLARLSPDSARSESLKLLKDESELVQVAAARVLADQGRRECLAELVRLLESADVAVRTESIRVLRSLTGQHFGFTVYQPADKRAPSVEAWKKWLMADGLTADLKFPLADVAIDLGRLLVCDMSQQKLIEYDASGAKTWEKQVGQAPWGCQGLSNGHRLVASYQEKSCVEYDEAGNEVWRSGELPAGAMSVQRLENGNTLLACPDASQVVEVAPDKTIVWKATIEGRPTFARRLEDGRTLVSMQQAMKIVEVDEGGKVVWELPTGAMSFSVDRTTAGTTLIADMRVGEVREYDRGGSVIWSKGGFQTPYTVQRLPNGNTLVVDRTGVKELDPKGASVRDMPMTNVFRAHRY